MIRIGNKIQQEGKSRDEFTIVINNIEMREKDGYVYKYSKYNYIFAEIYNLHFSRLAFDLTFKNAMFEISELNAFYQVEFTDLFDNIKIEKVQDNGNEKYVLSFIISFKDFENWKKPFSIQEFHDSMNERINNGRDLDFKWHILDDELFINGCGIVFETYNADDTIISFINYKLQDIKKYMMR